MSFLRLNHKFMYDRADRCLTRVLVPGIVAMMQFRLLVCQIRSRAQTVVQLTSAVIVINARALTLNCVGQVEA